jgi:mono/diheme cytochrome c family protein
MSPRHLPRYATRHLVACALGLLTLPAAAQTLVGNATTGQTLYNTTPNNSGVSVGARRNCTGCHSDVELRRSGIWGGPYADVSFPEAWVTLNLAITNQTVMTPLFSQLSQQQRADLAAYLADTPKVNAPGMSEQNELAFTAAAVGNAVSKTLTINHSLTVTDNLRVVSVALAPGTPATRFSVSQQCVSPSANIAPAGTCMFEVIYTPNSSSAESRTLTLVLRQGTTDFSRTITLNGSVAASPSANPDSGGGATGWLWQLGLSLGTLALLAHRQRARAVLRLRPH